MDDDAPNAAPESPPGDGDDTGDDDRSVGDDDTVDNNRSVGDDDDTVDDNRSVGDGSAAADRSGADEPVTDTGSIDDADEPTPTEGKVADAETGIPADVRKYERFTKMDGAQYDRVNEFLRDRTYITAREWAIARLCADFRTETGVEMTKIGENLPELVPFMTDTYSPQAVNQARSSFEDKVTQAGATFLYGAMSGFFTADQLDDLMYEVTEVAKFLLEVEGVDLAVADELDAEERISSVMRDVRQQSAELRHEEVECPNCGHTHTPESAE